LLGVVAAAIAALSAPVFPQTAVAPASVVD
jgi:hypothetical protein